MVYNFSQRCWQILMTPCEISRLTKNHFLCCPKKILFTAAGRSPLAFSLNTTYASIERYGLKKGKFKYSRKIRCLPF